MSKVEAFGKSGGLGSGVVLRRVAVESVKQAGALPSSHLSRKEVRVKGWE